MTIEIELLSIFLKLDELEELRRQYIEKVLFRSKIDKRNMIVSENYTNKIRSYIERKLIEER